MKWRGIMFDDARTKYHVVPAGLQRALLADLTERGVDVKAQIKDTDATGLENPAGMVHLQRPWETVWLPGLEIYFPSEDVLTFIERLKRYSVRTFAPYGKGQIHRPYYKLHDYLRCLVMHPLHYDALLRQLVAGLAQAEEKAKVFYADKKQMNEIEREIAARIQGRPIEEVSLLPGHHNRHIPRERGEA